MILSGLYKGHQGSDEMTIMKKADVS